VGTAAAQAIAQRLELVEAPMNNLKNKPKARLRDKPASTKIATLIVRTRIVLQSLVQVLVLLAMLAGVIAGSMWALKQDQPLQALIQVLKEAQEVLPSQAEAQPE